MRVDKFAREIPTSMKYEDRVRLQGRSQGNIWVLSRAAVE